MRLAALAVLVVAVGLAGAWASRRFLGGPDGEIQVTGTIEGRSALGHVYVNATAVKSLEPR